MGSKLQKNAIITGYINSYCLVCESYFNTIDETNDHMQEDAHVDKLTAHPYLEKYGDNHIRKVSKGYFCEFCSLLLATAARVTLHVQEKSHYEKKGTFLLRRPSGLSAVVAFEDVLIDERAWHSLSEETCAICNEEFANEDIHKTESGHLLRLVQSRVQFGADNSLYRTTDDSSFQCLTCNSVFALDTLSDHFNDPEHKKLYAKCQDELKKYLAQNKSNGNVSELNVKENSVKVVSKDKKTSGKKNVDKNHNNIADSSNSKDANLNGNATKEVKPEEKANDCKEIVPKTSNPGETEAIAYANKNNLTYNESNSNAFCRICETKLPAPLRSMKEHVNGKEHKSRVAKAAAQAIQTAKAKSVITKRPMKSFCDSILHIKNVLNDDVIVNDSYCVTLPSFIMVTKTGSRYRCQLCEESVYEDELTSHASSPRHARAAGATPVLTSLHHSELVREVRPTIFHCGFCNLIIPCWEEVESHLQSREHKESKDACAWRLRRHAPAIAEHCRRQEADFLHLLLAEQMFRRNY